MVRCGRRLSGSGCSNISPSPSASRGPPCFSIILCSSERHGRMLSLPLLEAKDPPDRRPPSRRLPPWLKRRLPEGNGNFFTQHLLRELDLETVCENARCPNRPEC